jgi:hypothetical protein
MLLGNGSCQQEATTTTPAASSRPTRKRSPELKNPNLPELGSASSAFFFSELTQAMLLSPPTTIRTKRLSFFRACRLACENVPLQFLVPVFVNNLIKKKVI